MKKYVTYTRVSTADQGKSGHGLKAQERDIEIFLTTFSEEPWEVIGEFQDVLSGGQDDSPATGQPRHGPQYRAELLVPRPSAEP